MTAIKLCLGGVLVVAAALGCASVPPCDVRHPEMVTKAAECRTRVASECAEIPDSECPAVADCDAWGNERCGFGAGGSR
jgi:hypothetical protein